MRSSCKSTNAAAASLPRTSIFPSPKLLPGASAEETRNLENTHSRSKLTCTITRCPCSSTYGQYCSCQIFESPLQFAKLAGVFAHWQCPGTGGQAEQQREGNTNPIESHLTSEMDSRLSELTVARAYIVHASIDSR